ALERGGMSLVDALSDTKDICIPAIVVAELWIGVELADSDERRTSRLSKISSILAGAEILPFDERVAPTYARIYAALRLAGTPIPANDLAVASLAVHFGHELVVGPQDEHHFRKVPGLTVLVLAHRSSHE
ncbi:MAG: PIN domain-containing protein, partial [Myxococcota bacterium]